MDEKDSMTPDTIPQSTPVDCGMVSGRKEEPQAGRHRRGRRRGHRAGRGWRVRIQGVREPSGVDGAPGVPVGRHGPEQGREVV